MPDKMSDRVPEDMPDRMPEDLPDRMPEDMPEDMPDHMPEDMPDRMSNRMSEDMSDRMPEDLPVRKCINVMVGITRSKVFFFFPCPGVSRSHHRSVGCHNKPMGFDAKIVEFWMWGNPYFGKHSHTNLFEPFYTKLPDGNPGEPMYIHVQ